MITGLSIPLGHLRTSGYDTTETYVIKRLYKTRIHPLKLRTVRYPPAMKENLFILVFIDISFIFISVYFLFRKICVFVCLFVCFLFVCFYLLIGRGSNLVARNYDF